MLKVRKIQNGKEIGSIAVDGDKILQQNNFLVDDYLGIPDSTIEKQLIKRLNSTGNYQSLYQSQTGYEEIE